MKQGYTHLTIILDRTGSMAPIREDTIGGFNTSLREQKAQPGEATLTLVQFDSQDPYEVLHDFRPIAVVPELTAATYVPRASTPLLDTLGRGIGDLAARLAGLPDDRRPEHTVFVIVTDGRENASLEFTRDTVMTMIRDAQDLNGWQFTFLSADLDAIREAAGLGIRPASSLHFAKTAQGTRTAYHVTSRHVSDLRSGKARDLSYSDDERKAQDDLRKRRKDEEK